MMLHAPIYWYQPRDADNIAAIAEPIGHYGLGRGGNATNEMLISQTPALYAGAARQSQRTLP